jgi:hypothetical protein
MTLWLRLKKDSELVFYARPHPGLPWRRNRDARLFVLDDELTRTMAPPILRELALTETIARSQTGSNQAAK